MLRCVGLLRGARPSVLLGNKETSGTAQAAARADACAKNAATAGTALSASDAELTPVFKRVWNVDFKGTTPFTNTVCFEDSHNVPARRIFRVLDMDGKVDPSAGHEHIEAEWNEELARKALQLMLYIRVFDSIMSDAQRQGRISFYLTGLMEEAAQVGTAMELHPCDDVFPQYREVGVLLWRGFPPDRLVAQLMGNIEDRGKGRQMPVHYGSPEHHFQTVSSPLATQIPQASGLGYARRLENLEAQAGVDPRIAVTYFGEGAASEGDFHSALNIASVIGSHTLFICRNNGYAISTPCSEQYAGDGIVARGVAYGMPSLRVDGTDIVATRYACRLARETILRENRPVLLELMTYRGGHHSTSDDATRYRGDVKAQWEWALDPAKRAEAYFTARGWWKPGETDDFVKSTRRQVVALIERHEALPSLPPEDLFEDVYAEIPATLQRQREQMIQSLRRQKEDPMPTV